MNIIILSDIHGSTAHIPEIAPELKKADLVLIAGDITTFGGQQQAHKVLYALSNFNNQILAVSGNCDTGEVEEYLQLHQNAIDGRCIRKDGVIFAGLGGSLQYRPAAACASPEDYFARKLDKLKSGITNGDPLVFVSHHPAYGAKIDSINEGKHAGSTAIRDFIEQTGPILAISGHMHEAIAIDNINGTTLINPGPFQNGKFAAATIEDGKLTDQRLCSLP